mmetsp:Transcript_13750/g.39114  ORF Transcript_13750/g.39114 Transcript_13750/m.39114 type:complete len:204 (+) Transcript_13750:396-1007(+)
MTHDIEVRLLLVDLNSMDRIQNDFGNQDEGTSSRLRRFLVHQTVGDRSHNRRTQHAVENEVARHTVSLLRADLRNLFKQMLTQNPNLHRHHIYRRRNLRPEFVESIRQLLCVFLNIFLRSAGLTAGNVDFESFRIVTNKLHNHSQRLLEIKESNDFDITAKHLERGSVSSQNHIRIRFRLLSFQYNEVPENIESTVVGLKDGD